MIDASEEVIEPFAVACMENLERAKTNSNAHLTGTVVLQRSGTSPGMKKLKSHLASGVPRAIGVGLGFAVGSYVMGGLLGGVVGGAVGLAAGATVAQALFGRTILLKQIPDNGAEPFWKGSRTYELGVNRSDAIDSPVISQDPGSKKIDPQALGNLLGEEMRQHPKEMAVAHLFGHGLAYRQAAGMDFGAYRAMLSQATTLAGRPVDLLLLESCLCGNLESLLATAPFARYAVVSEEVTDAGSISGAFSKAVKAAAGHSVTPGQLGQAVVRSNPDGTGELLRAFFGMRPRQPFNDSDPPEKIVRQTRAETLALVDMSKIEALGQAVDKLGGVLTREVRDGNLRAIEAASNEAIRAGHMPEMVGAKSMLGVGDLNIFLTSLASFYQSGLPSRQTDRVMNSLIETQEKLMDAVVEASIGHEYMQSAGLTVQLPTRHLEAVDSGFPDKMAGSAMPPRWREFVELASRNL